MFQFLTFVELSRSMAVILEMSQYVAYLKKYCVKKFNTDVIGKISCFILLRCLQKLTSGGPDSLFPIKLGGLHYLRVIRCEITRR